MSIGFSGNEDYVGASGDAGSDRNPAGVASHDLADDHSIVGFGGGMQPVDCFRGDGDGGIETEAGVGSAQIIIDGLGNAHYLDALLRPAHWPRPGYHLLRW